ncbi:MAG: hypothetical protein IPM54_13655 [Polyangiaceae bacterium]|nr:hypothetical protein [Polyangiaceae bacterium]
MTARQRVLLHLSDLTDEDVDALLPIVEHLRAKRLVPTHANHVPEPKQASAPTERRHPERFGPLAGSVKFVGDVESPVEPTEDWTYDEENIKP